jgi:short-subunit dehydrogenase
MVFPAYVGRLIGKQRPETALITRASSGIGLELAKLMAPDFGSLIVSVENR